MLTGTSPWQKYGFLCCAILTALCGGCLAPHKELANRQPAAPLPQLVRFYKVQQTLLKPGSLFISGGAGASVDGGKNTFTKRSPISSYPTVRMTIKSDNADLLKSCLDRIQAAKENNQNIDIRGMGIFTIESRIDPPLDTGIFTLTQLDNCGSAGLPPPVTTPAISSVTIPTVPGAVSAADLVAVPERYLDHTALITGHLASPVRFMDPVSQVMIESVGQTLSGYFLTTSLAPESRLSLVHASPGSGLVLEGTLTRITPQSLATKSGGTATTGYEFDVSRVISILPVSH